MTVVFGSRALITIVIWRPLVAVGTRVVVSATLAVVIVIHDYLIVIKAIQ